MTGESMIYVLNKSKTCERLKKSFNIVMLEKIKRITFLSFEISPLLTQFSYLSQRHDTLVFSCISFVLLLVKINLLTYSYHRYDTASVKYSAEYFLSDSPYCI